MRNAPTLGIIVESAPIAPLRGILVILLASAVALRRLDWWKLLERAGRLPTRRNQLLVHVAAIGLTFTAADAAEEVAEEEESPLRSAMAHALLRVTLEAALFYVLVTIALALGLSDGADNHDHQNDLLAYLADAFAGGWGEPLVHALACILFVAACEIARTLIVPVVVAPLSVTSDTRRPLDSVVEKAHSFAPVPPPIIPGGPRASRHRSSAAGTK